MAEPFLGELRMYSFHFPPKNWAFCDGAVLPIRQYPELGTLLGNAFGGDGKTTFGLPDLRGRIPVNQDTRDWRRGNYGGETTHVLNQFEMPESHGHLVQGSKDVGNSNVPQGNVLATTGLNAYRQPQPPQPLVQGTVGVTGGLSHENMSPYLAVNFCIALVGITPAPAEETS